MPQGNAGRQIIDGASFALNPLGYLLQNDGRLPQFLGGGRALDALGNITRPAFNTLSGWLGGGETPYRGPMSANSRGSWAPPSGGSGGYSPFNPAYSQAARANSPVGRSMRENRDIFRERSGGTYTGAASRNGNNGRLLGGGVLGSVWRQGGITFNDRQQTL